MITIKNRFTDEIIYQKEGPLIEVLEEAIKNHINFKRAALSGADFSSADLLGKKT